MTERNIQSAEGSGNAQASNGGHATTHNYYGANFPPEPRPARTVHLDPPPALFIGRERELAALHQHLAREGAVAYIPGQPGRGKSTLANYYAHLHQDEYQTVHMLACHAKTLAEIAAEFAWQLDLKLEGDLNSNMRQLRAYCANNRCLLILDNVDDEAPAGMILGGRSSVLVTTWHTNLRFLRPFRPGVSLQDFTEDQCFELFRRKIGGKEVDRHPAECRLLFRQLEFHPKALEIAAGLIYDDRRHTIVTMARKLPADIPALFAEAIAALSPTARELLAAMSACAPEGFRLTLAAQVAELDEDAAFDALNQLCARSLADELDSDTHRYRLHTLVRDAAHPTDAHRTRHAEAINEQFKGWEANRLQCEQDLADWQTAFTWSLNQPEDEAWSMAKDLASSGYSLTRRLGRLSEAYEVMQKSAFVADHRKDSGALQACYGNQALILQDWGRLDDAMALLKQQEALCIELGDKDGLSRCYGNQALILQAWGRLDDAMALHKQEEALCIELGNKDGLSRCYGNQALILKAWGRLDDAMALLKQQEALCIELGDKAGLSRCYGNQALILKAWGRLDDAMALHKQEEALYVELGDKAGLQACYGNQALILKAWGRLDDAMALHKQEEALCIELGDKAGLQACYGNQALILKAWGRLDDATALLKQQEALCIELGDKAGLARSYANQGQIARIKGDSETGRSKLQQALVLFTELGMPRERDLVQSWLDQDDALPSPESS